VISSTHFLKTGTDPGFGSPIDAKPFASQKAKAIRLSTYSFPVFVIRKPKQRSTYSKKGEGEKISPSTSDHVYP
jgi:hypothetical protein